MTEETFIEGIGNIRITGMVVRFDMFSLEPSSSEKEDQMKPVLRQRVVMPIDVFVRSVEKLRGTLPQLEKLGELKTRSTSEADELEINSEASD